MKRKPLVRWRLNARVRVDPGSAPDILNEEISGTQAGSRVRSSGLHACASAPSIWGESVDTKTRGAVARVTAGKWHKQIRERANVQDVSAALLPS